MRALERGTKRRCLRPDERGRRRVVGRITAAAAHLDPEYVERPCDGCRAGTNRPPHGRTSAHDGSRLGTLRILHAIYSDVLYGCQPYGRRSRRRANRTPLENLIWMELW